MISEAMQKVGNEGVIDGRGGRGSRPNSTSSRACSSTAATSRLYFITNAEKMVADLDQPYILIHEKKLSGCSRCCCCSESIVQSGRPLLIIAEDSRARCSRPWW